MANPKHIKRPVILEDVYANIAKNPSSTYYGNPIVSSFQYLNNWTQQGQIFSYSGPPQTARNDAPSDDGSLDGAFHVICYGADKADTSDPLKKLGGVLIPWKYKSFIDTGGSADNNVAITWQQSGAEIDLLRAVMESANYDDIEYTEFLSSAPRGFELYDPDFGYNPVSEFVYGTLRTEGIMTAALGVWSMPDPALTSAQTQVYYKAVAAGRAIRGYTGTGDASLGDLIHLVGDTAKGDSLAWNSARCLFQWGHPRGVWSDTNSYTELATDGRYMVVPQNYRQQPNTENTVCHPAFVATSTAATSTPGEEAAIRIKSYDSSDTLIDTWTCTFYDNAITLYDYSDGTPSTGLEINASDNSWISIEMKSGASELLLHTVSLWQGPEW